MLYIERALFVVGEQNSGKSTQLRSMFADYQLYGEIPDPGNLKESFPIGHDRSLYVRMTSPHEYGESPVDFHNKIRNKTHSGRWCIASPMQPSASNKMPNIVDAIKLFSKEFSPERIRVCFLYPEAKVMDSGQIANTPSFEYIPKLWNIANTECAYIDARTTSQNGTFLFAFFDFS